REAWTWSKLDHPNIVPFLGIANYQKICRGGLPQLCMISPWMSMGNIMEYTLRNPSLKRLPLLRDLANGLNYLHTHQPSSIVHGDIRGSNVLIDLQGREHIVARLTDFGLANVVESLGDQGALTTSTTSMGNIRWMAFERIFPEKYGVHTIREAKTEQSDIFELMRTFYEVLTAHAPFHIMTEMSVFAAVQLGQNPERPNHDLPELDSEMWRLMRQAWSENRNARPSPSEVLEYFETRSSFQQLVGHLVFPSSSY
ncbi:kinase-like protein, partial [Calocera viscosa TUFC12733]